MALLVADCPRCGASAMTFDVTSQVFIGEWHRWLRKFEVFSICRHCDRPTIFRIAMSLKGREISTETQEKLGEGSNLTKYPDALNPYFEIEGYVNLKDMVTIKPPQHLPSDIEAAFKEGAACMAIGCYNAGAAMFRLCLDLASKPLLPDPANAVVPQPNNFQRRNLGPRLIWLFDNGKLPSDLRGLASSVKDDGNDGTHAGTLTRADAEDLLDFTVAFLERH